MQQGPELEWLTRRLADCPEDFLLQEAPGQQDPDLEAVVADLLRDLGQGQVSEKETKAFRDDGSLPRATRRLALITSWLLHDAWFLNQARFASAALRLLSSGLLELSQLVKIELFVRDPDRREELVRLTLAALELIPAGENEALAKDRLTTLSSVERKRVLEATKAARDHAERVRKAMAEKAAEESAARYGRE
ncbi:MAG TPA: hypothetical protein VHM70_06185 [Polyangiaceae bacterium]|jgi:hypothetical protein|nr:hypothetical protein [Polyangiaceae bacterium]